MLPPCTAVSEFISLIAIQKENILKKINKKLRIKFGKIFRHTMGKFKKFVGRSRRSYNGRRRPAKRYFKSTRGRKSNFFKRVQGVIKKTAEKKILRNSNDGAVTPTAPGGVTDWLYNYIIFDINNCNVPA